MNASSFVARVGFLPPVERLMLTPYHLLTTYWCIRKLVFSRRAFFSLSPLPWTNHTSHPHSSDGDDRFLFWFGCLCSRLPYLTHLVHLVLFVFFYSFLRFWRLSSLWDVLFIDLFSFFYAFIVPLIRPWIYRPFFFSLRFFLDVHFWTMIFWVASFSYFSLDWCPEF